MNEWKLSELNSVKNLTEADFGEDSWRRYHSTHWCC